MGCANIGLCDIAEEYQSEFGYVVMLVVMYSGIRSTSITVFSQFLSNLKLSIYFLDRVHAL